VKEKANGAESDSTRAGSCDPCHISTHPTTTSILHPRMHRRAWKPILGAVAIMVPPAYLYFTYNRNPTFNISVKEKGPDGKPYVVKRSFPLISKPTVDNRINEFAVSTTRPSSQGLVWKHSTAYLASNDPIEDAHAQATISTEATSSDPARSLLFYAVMDGHAGFHTSRLLSHVLIPAVVLELSSSARDGSAHPKSSSFIFDTFRSLFSSRSLPHADAPQEGHVERVSKAIRRAFDNVDFEIVNGPLRVLAANVSKLDIANVPDLSQHPMAEASMSPALSGMSCVL
jgi:pyruvate dehydrogenase phosphatase